MGIMEASSANPSSIATPESHFPVKSIEITTIMQELAPSPPATEQPKVTLKRKMRTKEHAFKKPPTEPSDEVSTTTSKADESSSTKKENTESSTAKAKSADNKKIIDEAETEKDSMVTTIEKKTPTEPTPKKNGKARASATKGKASASAKGKQVVEVSRIWRSGLRDPPTRRIVLSKTIDFMALEKLGVVAEV